MGVQQEAPARGRSPHGLPPKPERVFWEAKTTSAVVQRSKKGSPGVVHPESATGGQPVKTGASSIGAAASRTVNIATVVIRSGASVAKYAVPGTASAGTVTSTENS